MFFLQQFYKQFSFQIAVYNWPEGPSEAIQAPRPEAETQLYPDAILRQAESAQRDAERSQWSIDRGIRDLEAAESSGWRWNETLVWNGEEDPLRNEWDEIHETEVWWETWETWVELPEWIPEDLWWYIRPEELEGFSGLSEEERSALIDQLEARRAESLMETASEIAEELGIEGFWEWWEAGEADLQARLDALDPEERQAFETMTPEGQRDFIRWLYAEDVAEDIGVINQAIRDTEWRLQQGWLSSTETQWLQQRAWALRAMQWAVGGAPWGSPWVGWSGGENGFYRWGIGEPLTPELLAEYGSTGHELASWLQQNNFPVYNGQPNYCGQNVWEALDAFGIQWLPTSGRHGYMWSSIMADRPSQFRQINTTPQEAPAGAIISYDRGTGGSSARQQYGHVEIALWNGSFYFGQVASWPGGSNRNPEPGSYTIFMPTSRTPGENPTSSAR